MKKHVGMVENTGKRCVVVFREIYDEEGNVVEPDKCLVVEIENLPDFAYQDIVSIVESGPAQSNPNLYEVLARTRFSDNSVVLQWLHNNNRLRKYDTSNIVMKPTESYSIKLSKLNRIIELQKAGYDEKDIERIVHDDTDMPPRSKNLTEEIKENTINKQTEPVVENTQVQSTQDGVLNDDDLAQRYLNQAKTLSEEAERLTNEAYELAPHLKPKTTTKRSNTTRSSSSQKNSTKKKSTTSSSNKKETAETKGETN